MTNSNFAEISYQAGRQYAAEPKTEIDFSKPPQVFLKEDFERGMTEYRQERTVVERAAAVKPPAQLSDKELVTEAREIHAQFQQLAARFEQAPANQRAEIREEMAPLVNRERELRQEFTGRVSPELTRDRVPEQQMAFSR